MPYLLDHCFFPQRPGWPDEADRWPVVPATTVIDHLMGAAEQAAPGCAGGRRARCPADQWIAAIPAVDVPVDVPSREGPGRVRVAFGDYARAVVELAAGLSADPPAPVALRPQPSERTRS